MLWSRTVRSRKQASAIIIAGVIADLWISCSAVWAQNANLVPRSGNEQPSFDCATAKAAAARLICADAELTRLDRELSAVFQKQKLQVYPPDQSRFVADELAWIRDRNEHCGLVGKNDAAIEVLANSKPCMFNTIRERIASLDDTGPPRPAPPSAIQTPQDNRGVSPTAVRKEDGPDVAACDEYAGVAIRFENVNPTLALPACANAVRQYPNSGRLLYELGRAYFKNNDFNSAAPLFQRGADQGFAAAYNGLGLLFLNGLGVPKDYARAMALFRKAADQGIASAKDNIGVMYHNGQGVAQDYSQAAAWYGMAADQGFGAAQNNLGVLYESGQGVTQDYEQAVALFRKAADQGFAAAQTNLGVLYEHGQGVTQDYEQAVALYRKAADQGNKPAQTNLSNLEAKVETEKLAKAKAEATEKLANAKQKGYQTLSDEDFKLDGKQLAAKDAKLTMQGFYKKLGDLETLQPSVLAAIMTKEYGGDSGVLLLTDDATRNIRKFFLECSDGCPVTVMGHADMCELTSLLGKKSVPCLAVEDGWQ